MPFFSRPENPKDIMAYYREEGLLKNINLESLIISDVPGTDDLGSFIRKIVWSPDGKRTIILAENLLPAKRVLKLYSSEKELDSLNWWVYDLETKEAKILPDGIMSAGWIDGNNLILNYQNQSLKKMDVTKGSEMIDLVADIKGKNQPEDKLFPMLLEKKIIFPMEKGFYLIDKMTGSASYQAVENRVISLIANSFSENQFLTETEKGFFLFEEDGKLAVKSEEIYKNPIYVSQDELLGVKNDGLVYSYFIGENKFVKYDSFELMDPEYLFSVNGKENILAITGEGGIYYLKNGEFQLFKEGDSNNQAVNNNPNNQNYREANQNNKLILVLATIIGTSIAFLYIRRKINITKKS